MNVGASRGRKRLEAGSGVPENVPMALEYCSIASWNFCERKAVLPFSLNASASCTGSISGSGSGMSDCSEELGEDWSTSTGDSSLQISKK